MHDPIRIAIAGFGNLGRSAAPVVSASDDLELVAILSRRSAAELGVDASTAVHPLAGAAELVGEVDVVLCCGGSKDDLPVQVPELARHFTVVDTFDTHAKIPEHFAALDEVATASGTVALLSTGWDPGLFSLHRLLGEAVLPEGHTATFWGRGLSQGHSDAVRRVPGVAGGVQYTAPRPEALARVRRGEENPGGAADAHTRHCFVVLEPGADADEVREAIQTMPDYFAPYETEVTFISAEELARDHAAMPHGGIVVRRGTTPDGTGHRVELHLELEHNPSFTASVLVAYGRAAHRLAAAGESGARTVFDVPLGLLSPRSPADLRRDLL